MEFLYEHILRTPPYRCVFIPIETVWGILKRNLPKNKLNRTFEINKAKTGNIGAEWWTKCLQHVIEIENSYRKNFVVPLIISITLGMSI